MVRGLPGIFFSRGEEIREIKPCCTQNLTSSYFFLFICEDAINRSPTFFEVVLDVDNITPLFRLKIATPENGNSFLEKLLLAFLHSFQDCYDSCLFHLGIFVPQNCLPARHKKSFIVPHIALLRF